MRLKKIIKILLLITSFTALYFFCGAKTRGFRYYQILSNLPNDPRFEVPHQDVIEINKKLDQSFTFLGSGGWCYAFLGEDQTTVLKFYKHDHLELPTLIKEFCWSKLLFKSPIWPKDKSYPQELNFKSCILLYNQIKDRTGLLYVHINKTQGLHKPVILFDPLGIKHVIDLDKTEFVVQTKAELILPYLNALMQKADIKTAKMCIDEILSCLHEIQQKGIYDLDLSFRNNFGYVNNKAVTLDLSSFVLDTKSQTIRAKTKRLEHYLRKYHPILHIYYQDKINQIEPL